MIASKVIQKYQKTLRVITSITVALSAVPMTFAQMAPSEVAVRVSEAQKANAIRMQQYSWTSRTEVIDQGQVKDIRIDLVNYGPGGQLQRSLINDQGAPLPGGFLRRRIAERERQKTEEYLAGLRDVLEWYTLPTAGKVQAFLRQAKATGPDATGAFELTGQNVVLLGDTFSQWVDPLTRHPRKIQVSTNFQGDPVNLTATFKTLPNGPNYVAYAEVTVPAKQISVQVQNFDYNRNN